MTTDQSRVKGSSFRLDEEHIKETSGKIILMGKENTNSMKELGVREISGTINYMVKVSAIQKIFIIRETFLIICSREREG